MSAFARAIGIDYSGAETPTASLKGLRVYLAEGDGLPVEVPPPPSPRKYWTRKGIAEWLVERLAEDAPTLVGIDHGFSFPLRYFETHGLLPDWPRFLDDFQRHWPTDEDHTYVEFVRDGINGNGAARMGNARWRRLTEERAGGAKSVFHFDVQGSVAKSTHAGIPWLRFIRQRLGPRVHFWPFDGWDISAGRSAIAEVYPALWSRGFASEGRTGDQHDAFSIAAWLSRADRDSSLARTTHSPAAGFHTGSDLSKEIKHLEETGVIPRITPSECRPECRPAATSSSARRSAWITQLYSFPELPPDAAQFLEQVFFDYADRVASDALRNHLASTPVTMN